MRGSRFSGDCGSLFTAFQISSDNGIMVRRLPLPAVRDRNDNIIIRVGKDKNLLEGELFTKWIINKY